MRSVLPNKPPAEPVLLRLEDVDIPVPALQKENPTSTGSALASSFFAKTHSIHPINRPFSFNVDATDHGYTALRETKEEIGVVVSPEAVFPLVYRRTFKLKGLRMVYYTSVAQLGAKVPVTVSHEHIAWGFFDEEAVRNFGPFVKEKSRQVKHVMLEAK
ncbi:hypothetical protein C8Q69DRAFT_511187 [Paecilomyces variotii]|uniref:Nudix hydrolase domain-containing protein n=1 Tax=Byssochlamys spectabilis TaxID=264951 RepID=A0A443HHB7_BYSSP|nr:hypothetical protein C8Q69DRAFT_511187 [Paecilomyces variotii]RWQ91221.1 hypothetical protein C8Q69DRAFT_511187 [Paecilomyces variotii]